MLVDAGKMVHFSFTYKRVNKTDSLQHPCHIFYLFRCVLSFSATLAKRWKVQFPLGLAKTLNDIDYNNGIQISKKEYYANVIESTVDIHRKNTVNKMKNVVKKVHTKER